MSRLVLTLALLALSAIGAQAQNYPTRAATVIVPFAAGGPADITGRIVADIFSRHARPAVRGRECRRRRRHHRHDPRRARQLPDGYTIVSGHLGTNALPRSFYPEPRLQPGKGLRADRADRRAAGAAHDPQGVSRPTTSGIRRLRQGQREQAEHGACRRRLGVLYRLPAAQPRDRHQADARAVHRHRARASTRCSAARSTTYCDPVLGPLPHVRAGTAEGDGHRHQEAAARCCRTCRPRRKQGMPEFDMRAVLRGVRAEGHAAGRSSTSSPTRSTRASTRRPSASG